MDNRFNLTCEHCKWVEENHKIFKGNSRPTHDMIPYIYTVYNEIFKTSKKPGSCGMCLANTIDQIRTVTNKYCEELCKQTTINVEEASAQEPTGEATLQEDQKAPKTSRRKPSAKRTKS